MIKQTLAIENVQEITNIKRDRNGYLQVTVTIDHVKNITLSDKVLVLEIAEELF